MDFNQLLNKSKVVEKNVLAPNTEKNYIYLLRRYEKLSKSINGFPRPFPITEEKMRVFIEYYRSTHPSTSYGCIKQFVSAFSYHFRINNLRNLTRRTDFIYYIKGLQKVLYSQKVPNAKLPITKDILIKITNSINKYKKNEIQGMFIASLCFYGFLRISECLKIQTNNFKIENNRIIIKIEFSKTEQTGKTCMIYIHSTNTIYSPFIWYYEYIKYFNPTEYLFNFSDNKFRRFLRKKLSIIFPNNYKEYSSHSLRKGAAYTAALNGVQDCQIKKMGRWKSDCYQIYTSVTDEEAGEKVTTKI